MPFKGYWCSTYKRFELHSRWISIELRRPEKPSGKFDRGNPPPKCPMSSRNWSLGSLTKNLEPNYCSERINKAIVVFWGGTFSLPAPMELEDSMGSVLVINFCRSWCWDGLIGFWKGKIVHDMVGKSTMMEPHKKMWMFRDEAPLFPTSYPNWGQDLNHQEFLMTPTKSEVYCFFRCGIEVSGSTFCCRTCAFAKTYFWSETLWNNSITKWTCLFHESHVDVANCNNRFWHRWSHGPCWRIDRKMKISTRVSLEHPRNHCWIKESKT